MKLDKFSQPIFDDTDIFKLLYSESIDYLSSLTVLPSKEISLLEDIADFEFNKYTDISADLSIQDYDKLMQEQWAMPNEYKNFDIEYWLYQQCNSDEEIFRIKEELTEFKQRNMIGLLQWLKYFVDVCRENKILWGLGRGSSVASFVLYKIGVHKINSCLYQLDWREFLK